jgi:hypothetical protein
VILRRPTPVLLLPLLAGCSALQCVTDGTCWSSRHPPLQGIFDDADGDAWPAQLDCDPTDPNVHPQAEEQCDRVDNDCDGFNNEGLVELNGWSDRDGDGVGELWETGCLRRRDPPRVSEGGDCDDDEAAVYPGAAEVCDGLDNNCDGQIDVSPVSGGEPAWPDADADGVTGSLSPSEVCPGTAGWVEAPSEDLDCDDDRAAAHPGAPERCNDLDDNCDGLAETLDDTRIRDRDSRVRFYRDADGDGFGAAEAPRRQACALPAGFVSSGGDCDDGDAATSPLGLETCDGRDEDCDGLVDEGATDARLFYVDADGDGVGGASEVWSCAGGPGLSRRGGDCDDADPARSPDAIEDCGAALDLNCDGLSGDVDHDGDGWPACLDCDDADPARAPDAVEVCDDGQTDEDCDGLVDDDDDSVAGELPTFVDVDGDGVGGAPGPWVCTLSAGLAQVGGDCEEADPRVFPGAPERCGAALDFDCDGLPGACSTRNTTDEAAVSIGPSPQLWPQAGGGLWALQPADADGPDRLVLLGPDRLLRGRDLPLGPADAIARGLGRGEGFGAAALTHVDLDGDGLSDLLVGAPLADGAVGQEGRVSLFVDGAVQHIAGLGAGGEFGAALLSPPGLEAGRLWVGSPGLADDVGAVYAFADPLAARTPEAADRVIWGEVPGGRLGLGLASVGDLDGDGAPEVGVSCAACGPEGMATLLIFDGAPASQVASEADLRLLAPRSWGPSPVVVAAPADLDADGRDDLVLGLPAADFGAVDGGAVRILRSSIREHWQQPSAVSLGAEADGQLNATEAHQALGASFSRLPGDGGPGDLLVGAPGALGLGAVYRLPVDEAVGAGALPTPYLRGGAQSPGAGSALWVGDLNGDRAPDLLVGCGSRHALLLGGTGGLVLSAD